MYVPIWVIVLIVFVFAGLCWWFYCLGGRDAYRDVLRNNYNLQ